jgi:Flp pilus assembly protein TadG
MTNRIWKFLRSQRRGNAMIEFAISFGVLFPVLSGSFQFGYSFFLYNEMQTATRSGARYASRLQYDSMTSTPSTAYESAIQNLVVYGDPDGGADPIVPGLTPANVTVEMTFVNGAPGEVTIGIDNYRADAVIKPIDFNTKPHVTHRYVGRWSE